MEDPNHIHIFKTNISTVEETALLEKIFSGFPEIQQWSIDLEDIDRVLRVVSETLSCTEIIVLLQNSGLNCSDLDT